MKARRAAMAGVVIGGVAHAAPALTSFGPVRRLGFDRLSGLGLPHHLALTFDDGPDPASTPMILDALAALGWRATFFMLGCMVERAPRLAGEVAAAGHEVAIHGHRHHSHLRQTPAAITDDLRRGLDAVQSATGAAPRWFRPPFGNLSGGSLLAARRVGLQTVLWSAWGRDWRATATPHTVVADVRRGLTPGATVLLHDSDCTSAPGSWRATLGALPLLADVFGSMGFQVGSLDHHGV